MHTNSKFPEEAHNRQEMRATVEKLKEDNKAAKQAWKKHLANGSKTISHEELMKKIGWNEL